MIPRYYIGNEHCLTALHIALILAGVKAGDEVTSMFFNVSNKVVRIIVSWLDYINRTVWKKH